MAGQGVPSGGRSTERVIRRVLLALVVAMTALSGHQALASTPLVLSASSAGQGVATFRLTTPLTLTDRWSISGAGSFRVAAIMPVHPKDEGDKYGTIIWDSAVTDRGILGSAFPVRLPPRDYYLFLSSDKAVSVSLPSSSPGGRRQLKMRSINLQSVLTQGPGEQSTPPSSEEQHDHPFIQRSSVTFFQAYARMSAPVGAGRDTVTASITGPGCDECFASAIERTAADESFHDYSLGVVGASLSAYTGFTGPGRISARYESLGLHHVDRWTFLSMSFPSSV